MAVTSILRGDRTGKEGTGDDRRYIRYLGMYIRPHRAVLCLSSPLL